MPTRRALPHAVPLSIDPSREVWFLTICCQARQINQIAREEVGPSFLETIQYRHVRGLWWTWLALLMPDHVHLLLSFPVDGRGMAYLVTEWKRWTARTYGINWQRDFFDHRIRRDESFSEKAQYILNNPVRAGLVKSWEEWPFSWWPEKSGFTRLDR
jgi:putative transposase